MPVLNPPLKPLARPMAPPAVPRHVAALGLVSRSTLNAGEKALLHAMIEWWNPVSGELWPSVASLSQATGFSDRGVQRILRRLVVAGVVELVATTRGGTGRTNRYRLHLDRLTPRQANPVRRSPSTRRDPPANPDQRSAGPRPAIRVNPDRRSDEPSIQNPPTETTIRELPANQASSRGISAQGGCMDGAPSLKATLASRGVRGHVLDRLASAASLTPTIVEEEWRAILERRDIRNRAAVLVSRLSQRANIELRRSPPLNKSMLSVVAKLEQLRRLRGGA